MKKLKVIATLALIASTLFFARCDKSANACPKDMVECQVNGNHICVPKSIGC